jgi:hypothetical protein
VDSYLLGGKRVTIGLSATVGFTAGSYNQGFILKRLGLTGSLEGVMGLSFVVGSGYPIESEIIEVSGPAQFFLAASGATQVVGVWYTYSAGATGLPTLPPITLGLL